MCLSTNYRVIVCLQWEYVFRSNLSKCQLQVIYGWHNLQSPVVFLVSIAMIPMCLVGRPLYCPRSPDGHPSYVRCLSFTQEASPETQQLPSGIQTWQWKIHHLYILYTQIIYIYICIDKYMWFIWFPEPSFDTLKSAQKQKRSFQKKSATNP